MRQALILLIRFYQETLSFDHGPMRNFFPGTHHLVCRYEPTCSTYMIQGIEKFGSLRGIFIGVQRILRCHPYSNYPHIDPIP